MATYKSGTAVIKDLARFLSWYRGLSLQDARGMYKFVTDNNPDALSAKVEPTVQITRKMFYADSFNGFISKSELEDRWVEQRDAMAKQVERFFNFAHDFNLSLNVALWLPEAFAYVYLGNPDEGILVPHPEEYLEYLPPADYSNMTPMEVRAVLNVSADSPVQAIVPTDAQNALTTANLNTQKQQLEQECSDILQQIEDVKFARTTELAAMQAKIQALQDELNAQKESLMNTLNEKMAEMNAAKEHMENQIYLLDSQIYAIRCFAGDIVTFTKLKSGKNAPDTEPVVIHQKLRFLDEDLGRLASLYEIQWEKISLFEEFLKHSPLAMDTFAPNERCVVLVRVSRTGVSQGANDNLPYSNIIKDYQYYHGRTVGIIIRNGENLYLGWTDEKRINIDDDLIISNVVTSVEPVKETVYTSAFQEEQAKEKQKHQARAFVEGVISRAFVYNILQGIVEHSSLLPLPAGVTLAKQSEYVVYAVADKWLSDNRFGSFTKIVERCNDRVQPGDMLLTVQRLVAERYGNSRGQWGFFRTWENVRGRGDANRTHDVVADDCTLYPANLVEYDEPIDMVKFFEHFAGEPREKWRELRMSKSDFERRYQHSKDDEDVQYAVADEVEHYQIQKRHVFVSLEKRDSWHYQGDAPRANFELYDGEFINLTYMNSIWLEWVITNKTLGDWNVGGNYVDYSYAIRYLKTALDFVRSREAEERSLIDAVNADVCKDPNWPLKLSEWKLNAGIRTITPYQAKRFVRHCAATA